MIIEMSQLAARKLAHARTRASSAVATCSSILSAIHAIEEAHQYKTGVSADLASELSRHQRLISELEYLALMQLIDRTSNSQASVLRTVGSFFDAEERRITEIESRAQADRKNIVLPRQPEGCAPHLLGAFGGWIVGNIVWLVVWGGVGQIGFNIGWILLPILGAIILPPLSWFFRCVIIKSRVSADVEARLAVVANARRSLELARQTLAGATK